MDTRAEALNSNFPLLASSRTFNLSPGLATACFFLSYLILWTVLPLFTNTSINRDTVEILYWGNEWQLGYFKHPPLLSWLCQLAFLIFGTNDLVFIALSQGCMALSFWVILVLAGSYLPERCAHLAILALPVIGYYSFITPHLNHNIILNPLWCLSLLLAYRAIEERRDTAWLGLGLTIGVGLWCKYTIVIIPTLVFAYLLASPRHRPLLREIRLWQGVGVCLAVIAPHVWWLAVNDFPTLQYLITSSGLDETDRLTRHLGYPLEALAKMGGMCLPLALLLGLALGRPRIQTATGRLTSRDRFLLVMTLGPVALVMVLSVLTGGELKTEWATPFFFTLPLVILRHLYPHPDAGQIRRFYAWLGRFSVAMATVYALIFSGLLSLLPEAKWSQFPARELARQVAAEWEQVCAGPVPVIVGDRWLAGTAAYQLPEQPRVYPEANPAIAPWLNDQAIRDSGAIILWDRDQPDWFPGLRDLSHRFGTALPAQEVVLTYPRHTNLAPVRLGIAVVPPALHCRQLIELGML